MLDGDAFHSAFIAITKIANYRKVVNCLYTLGSIVNTVFVSPRVVERETFVGIGQEMTMNMFMMK